MPCFFASAQTNYRVAVTLKDSLSGEALTGAAVYIAELAEGNISNAEGVSVFQLSPGQYTLQFSFLGYSSKDKKIKVDKDTAIVMYIQPSALQLKEVVVGASRSHHNVQHVQGGIATISGKEINALPALLGEKDPVRALQYIPGVQTVTDGDMGYYVRGGSPDQNLILFDNAMVYNPSHVLGFFSVFNNDVVDNVKLIKSGIPAEYGNRLSSVIDIHSADTIPERYAFKGSLGLISSKAGITGPLILPKTAFFLSARVSYIDKLIKPFLMNLSENMTGLYQNSAYSFYDVNAKLISQVTTRDKISFSFYQGKDNFSMKDRNMNYDNKLFWGNRFGILNWNHIFRDDWYVITSACFTTYNFTFDASQQHNTLGVISGIDDIGLKSKFVKTTNKQRIRFGFDYQKHIFKPNNITAIINENHLNTTANQKIYTHEGSLFLAVESDVNSRLRIDAGLRLTGFVHLGPFDQYIKNAFGEINDTIHHEKNSLIKDYYFPEPRLSCRYLLDDNSSLKFSFLLNNQYLHMATASSVTFPADIWLPSSIYLKPQKGFQSTLGYFRDFYNRSVSAYADLYYKESYNQIELLKGILNDFSDNLFEQSIVFGKGRSYGLELYLKKNTGVLTGWIGYALSRHTRKFDAIEGGKIYPANYDRRHDAKLALIYKINLKWSVSALFIYASGNALTIPDEKYLIDGNILSHYSSVNSFRMPAYHRLDVSATRSLKKKGRFESELVFSAFNVYNRPNPFYLYYAVSSDLEHYALTVEARQICVFPVLPSLTWSFKF
ncbi:MAG: TonB-dependent receptor [Bacteroidales bacterium]|nr:TonB-dependent receptor [Bacteroidales bacterium]MBN2764714.1 TonB-dependent receptor [Bacteroidales bacterium]